MNSERRRHRVLFVDDDVRVLETLKELFEDDYEVLTASSGREAIELAARYPDLAAVVLDIRMPEMDGIEAARLLRDAHPDLSIIFNSGYPGDYDEDEIDRQELPFEYVLKGEAISRLQRAIRNAVKHFEMRTDPLKLVAWAETNFGLTGRSQPMLNLFRKLELAVSRDDNILLLGESGTGKSVAAREIHNNSGRVHAPFKTLLCSDKDQTALESELFGHEKGAYTDADFRMGLFRSAAGGSVFFDEIGDMSVDSQKKLLKVVEEKRFTPLGADIELVADVRIMAATNKDMEEMIGEGRFKQDLFYRFEKHKIFFPALREHAEDIPFLIRRFAARCERERHLPTVIFDVSAITLMQQFHWPGNVRQLETVVEDAVCTSASSFLVKEDIAPLLESSAESTGGDLTLNGTMKRAERLHILSVLERTGYNVTGASELLQVDRATLYRKISDHGIDVRLLRGDPETLP